MKQFIQLCLYFTSMVLIAAGHSWVENIEVQNPNSLDSRGVGFIRNYTARAANLNPDIGNTHQLSNTSPDQPFCSPFQDTQFQVDGLPRLNALPGSQIVAYYLENGHISNPASPDSVVGNVYWFGAESNVPDDNTTFGEVQDWELSAGRGRLLGTAPFDDGRCGRGDPQLPCHSAFQIPDDVPIGSIYTIYWLWDYSGKIGPNTGHIEFYTSCMDIDIR